MYSIHQSEFLKRYWSFHIHVHVYCKNDEENQWILLWNFDMIHIWLSINMYNRQTLPTSFPISSMATNCTVVLYYLFILVSKQNWEAYLVWYKESNICWIQFKFITDFKITNFSEWIWIIWTPFILQGWCGIVFWYLCYQVFILFIIWAI